MNLSNKVFHLDVRQIARSIEGEIKEYCQFTLSWGQAQRLFAEVDYRRDLDTLYEEWRKAYISYYKARSSVSKSSLRGEVVASGTINPLEGKRSQLIQAEKELLKEFYKWLGDGNLQEIRETLEAYANFAVDAEQVIDVFLICHQNQDQGNLAKFPWEDWKISKELPRGKIRIARLPASLHKPVPINPVRRSRARILTILGSDEGLKLANDINALRQLQPSVEIQFVGDNKHQSESQTLQEILTKLTDAQGWDVLVFAGHSGEAQAVGGKLAIPGFSIGMEELRPALEKATSRGLHLGIFNSCKGLDIAESLIDFGLNQVVVMREEIDDEVANEFLRVFVLNLKQHNDVHTSVIKACEALSQSEYGIEHPSAYLMPSLFRRPDSTLFRIPSRLRWFRLFRPKRYEAIVLSLVTLASLSPLQQEFLSQRVNVQAIYREFIHAATGNTISTPPPIAILQIDQASINQAMKEANTNIPVPIPQGYLAKLIRQLPKQSKVVGIDYLLDRPQGKQGEVTKELGDAIAAANKQGKRFIFGCTSEKTKSPFECNQLSLEEIVGSKTGPNIAEADAILGYANFGNTDKVGYRMPLLWQEQDKNEQLPFAYWLAWLRYARSACTRPHAQVHCNATNKVMYNEAIKYIHIELPRLNRSGITSIGHAFHQAWLHPITDFSIHQNQVYRPISAQEFLKAPDTLSQETVLIAAGGYDEAGIENQAETFTPPTIAQKYLKFDMTRGEQHAYLFYLFLNKRIVVPIPDLWILWVAALAGKSIIVFLQWRSSKVWAQTTTSKQVKKLYQSPWFWALPSGTALYSLISLHLYLSSIAILLPIVLPVIVFWAYVLPPVMKREI
ncbi:CHASE2 domain-containing protein [Komarekiella sp. 'clone 1']|uniref:CHASE2 domain-containing protein n=1 Tax=Komarekiella delphini-convector SJRDD-AB1 TaxID=2593771 RepID=A0AA40VQ58_9NOST|nr:CHASE2 domain-containing protein [Komarekiella delphini-convector]MBD6615422.1 CHASE2 domain-containing protein [Komarekiella delphini-convector SJRDD-AB1]